MVLLSKTGHGHGGPLTLPRPDVKGTVAQQGCGQRVGELPPPRPAEREGWPPPGQGRRGTSAPRPACSRTHTHSHTTHVRTRLHTRTRTLAHLHVHTGTLVPVHTHTHPHVQHTHVHTHTCSDALILTCACAHVLTRVSHTLLHTHPHLWHKLGVRCSDEESSTQSPMAQLRGAGCCRNAPEATFSHVQLPTTASAHETNPFWVLAAHSLRDLIVSLFLAAPVFR